MATRIKPWTQKYAPNTLKEVFGQETVTFSLKNFVVNFKKERRKATILYGPTGCGKTCSVYAVANELNLEVIELNASDFRTAEGISSIIGNASKQMSLFHKGKIILVDELDGVSGTKDRGGIPEVIRVIEKTAFPIVITANDPFEKKFSALRKKAALSEFSILNNTDVLSILKNIVEKEGITCDEQVLKTLARRSGGDGRSAINDLQMLARNNEIKKEDLESLSDRERVEEITTALTKIFKTTDPLIAKNSFHTVSEDLNQCLLWVDENLPKEYDKAEDRARAYDYISQADVMNRRIRRWQHWRFMVYINDYLSAGVAVSKDEKYKKFVEYTQTKRLLKIWMANRKYQKRLAICEKIANASHSSKKEVLKNTYHYIKAIFQKGKDKEVISKLADEFDLDKEEVAYLKR